MKVLSGLALIFSLYQLVVVNYGTNESSFGEWVDKSAERELREEDYERTEHSASMSRDSTPRSSPTISSR